MGQRTMYNKIRDIYFEKDKWFWNRYHPMKNLRDIKFEASETPR